MTVPKMLIKDASTAVHSAANAMALDVTAISGTSAPFSALLLFAPSSVSMSTELVARAKMMAEAKDKSAAKVTKDQMNADSPRRLFTTALQMESSDIGSELFGLSSVS